MVRLSNDYARGKDDGIAISPDANSLFVSNRNAHELWTRTGSDGGSSSNRDDFARVWWMQVRSLACLRPVAPALIEVALLQCFGSTWPELPMLAFVSNAAVLGFYTNPSVGVSGSGARVLNLSGSGMEDSWLYVVLCVTVACVGCCGYLIVRGVRRYRYLKQVALLSANDEADGHADYTLESAH